MIEELPSRTLAYRFTHELVRRALYDRLTGVRRAELHLRVGEALEQRRRALRPRARRPRAPLRRRGAARRRPSAASTTTCSPRGRRPPRSPSTRRSARLRTALELRIESPHARAPRCCSSSGPPATAPARRSTRSTRSGRRRGIARELGDARAARAGGDRLRGRVLAAGHRRPGRGRAARGGGGRARRRELGAARRAARRARPRARLPGRARARGDRPRRARSAMARQLDDRAGLATVLMRAYWSRGTSTLDEILAMLTEAIDLGEELGDTEIRAEAMSWRVPAFVALGDLDAARREVAALQRDRRADGAAVHAPRRRALRLGDRAVRRPARRGRGDGAALARVEPPADRARRVGRLRHPDVRHPPRAGPAGRARAGDPDPGRRAGSAGPWRPGLVVACSPSSAWRTRRGASSRASPPKGSTRFRESLWLASLTYLTDAVHGARRRGDGRARLPGARAARGRERDDRPPRRLLRRRRPLPRHARRHARRVGPRRGALRARAELNRAHGHARRGSPTPLYQHARALLARGDGARGRRPLLGEAAALAEGSSACRRCSPASGRSAPPRRRPRLPDGLSSREVADPRPRRPRPQQPRDRRRRCRSASTRPPTTSAASCARRAAPTAPQAASYAHRHGLSTA